MTVQIRRGEDGDHPTNTNCSLKCLNAKFPVPPTLEEEVLVMKHCLPMTGKSKGWQRQQKAKIDFYDDKKFRSQLLTSLQYCLWTISRMVSLLECAGLHANWSVEQERLN
jgi:hypothetical protein